MRKCKMCPRALKPAQRSYCSDACADKGHRARNDSGSIRIYFGVELLKEIKAQAAVTGKSVSMLMREAWTLSRSARR